MIQNFVNRFGQVAFTLASEVMPVRDIRGATLSADLLFDVETAEKIALITENRRVQICPFKTADGWRCYVVLHETSGTAAVAKIDNLSYTGGTPAAEIQAQRIDALHSRPSDITLPEGWTWERVEEQRAKWGIASNMVPIATAPGVVAWGTVNSVRNERR